MNERHHKQMTRSPLLACNTCDSINPNCMVKANCEVPILQKLQPMTSSGRQQPDNAMYLGDEVGSSSETCSSPMLWMERKATIGAADLFCLQRWKLYTNINFITTFAFPNMQDPCCLTEITAAWKNFYFSTKLTNHTIQWRVRYRISNKHSVLQSSPSVANKSHIIQWIEPQL